MQDGKGRVGIGACSAQGNNLLPTMWSRDGWGTGWGCKSGREACWDHLSHPGGRCWHLELPMFSIGGFSICKTASFFSLPRTRPWPGCAVSQTLPPLEVTSQPESLLPLDTSTVPTANAHPSAQGHSCSVVGHLQEALSPASGSSTPE